MDHLRINNDCDIEKLGYILRSELKKNNSCNIVVCFPDSVEAVRNTSQLDVNQMIIDTIRDIGIPAHLSGYRYIRDAITFFIENNNEPTSATKILYPTIAKKHNVAPNHIERAIRNAIEVGFRRGNKDVLNKIFGHSVDINKGKPTNMEFIATVADYLFYTMKKSWRYDNE